MSFKNFPMVSKVVFGRGSFNQMNEIIAPKRQNERAPFIYFIDDVFENNTTLISRISLLYEDYIIFISANEEPKTSQVDALVDEIILKTKAHASLKIKRINKNSKYDFSRKNHIFLPFIKLRRRVFYSSK